MHFKINLQIIHCYKKTPALIVWCQILKFSLLNRIERRERDLNPRDLHRSQAFNPHLVPGLRPTRLGDPGSESTQFFLYIKY